MAHPALETEDFPEELAHLWRYYQDISLGRPSSGLGPSVLAPLFIKESVRALFGVDLAGREVRAILRVDAGVMTEESKMRERDRATS